MKKPNSILSILLIIATFLCVTVTLSDARRSSCRCRGRIKKQGIFGRNAGTKWSSVALQIIEEINKSPDPTNIVDVPVIARRLALFSNCMYDAYCFVKGDCTPILFDQAEQARKKKPASAQLAGRKRIRRDEAEIQVSYAAFYALEKLFDKQFSQAIGLLEKEGLKVSDVEGSIGANVCEQVINIRSTDGNEEMGSFTPSNVPSKITSNAQCRTIENKGTWQPLCIPPSTPGATFVQTGPTVASANIAEGTAPSSNDTDLGQTISPKCNPQEFPSPQYADIVMPFVASTRKTADTIGAPPRFGSRRFDREFDEVLQESGSLDDFKKTVAEYWDDNPFKTFPPGQFYRVSLEAAVKNNLKLKNTVALQMTMGNAMLDAAIAAWSTKKKYDLVRPITVIQCQRRREKIKAWRKPYRGVTRFVQTARKRMSPYLNTPPFPGYVSGHSTFGGAAEAVLISWFGPNYVGPNCWVRRAGRSEVEPRIRKGKPGFKAGLTDIPNSGPMTRGYSPARRVRLCWNTWREASDENGISRIYGGVHIEADNKFGILLGRLVGSSVDKKARKFTNIEGAGGERMKRRKRRK